MSVGSDLYPVKVIYLYCNKEILQHTGIIFSAWQFFHCLKTVKWWTSRQLSTGHIHICHYSVLRCQYLWFCCTQIWLTIYAIKIQGTLVTSHLKLDIYIYYNYISFKFCCLQARYTWATIFLWIRNMEQYRNLEVVLHKYSIWEMCVLMDPYSDKLVIPSCSLCSHCILILSGFLSKFHKFLFSAVKFIMSVITLTMKHSIKLSGRNSWKWVIMQEAEMSRIGGWKILKLYTLCSYIRCHIWHIQKNCTKIGQYCFQAQKLTSGFPFKKYSNY
jgi:hypothetical protein